jgi:hypothetical protein
VGAVRATSDIEILSRHIQRHWGRVFSGMKVERYIGKFFDRERTGQKIVARVQGNHGVYTVLIEVEGNGIRSACSCYIGKGGECHHCVALGKTFLDDSQSFVEFIPISLDDVKSLDDLPDYLKSVSLASLTDRLKAAGITQKAFAESIGLTPNYLTGLKASEKAGRHRYELGAVKLACLWTLAKFGK